MKRITLNRNGQKVPRDVEESDLKAGRFGGGRETVTFRRVDKKGGK